MQEDERRLLTRCYEVLVAANSDDFPREKSELTLDILVKEGCYGNAC